jgi:anaerobic selenocysteine-containing dehydrogenase
MTVKPTSDELIELMCTNSTIPLATVKEQARGRTYPDVEQFVQPKDEGWEARLDVANDEMMEELAEVERGERLAPDSNPDYPFRLLPRRNRGMYNSGVNDGLATRGKRHNPAFMNPDDLAALGLESGDLVDVASQHGSILAIVEPDPNLRTGVVSMFHAYGDTKPATDRSSYLARGSNTALLLGGHVTPDPFSGQPRMGNEPVSVTLRERERNAVPAPA